MILLRVFSEICFFKKDPQDLPASVFLLMLVLVVNAVIGLSILLIEVNWVIALLESAVSLGLLIGFTWGILALSGKTARFQQTLTAILGADCLLSLVALPLLMWTRLDTVTHLPHYLLFGLMLWNMAVIAHIIRHALSRQYSFGLGLVLLYLIVSFQLMAYLFPVSS